MLNETLELYYFIIVFIAMLYAFYKAGLNSIGILIVLIFWQGLFQYLSYANDSPSIYNIFKILIVVLSIFLSWKKIFITVNKKDKIINFIFILFTASFWSTFIFHGGDIFTILSQYLFKYSLIFFLYHYFKDVGYNFKKREYLKHLLLKILYIQIVLSIVKIAFFGFGIEPIVGSMSARGAGIAVVLPIVGLIFYWIIKDGKFKRLDWIISILIFSIALASGKRQPIIFFPIIMLALFTLVQKRIHFSNLIKFIPLILILFYVGVRLTPSFTPENNIWGSFNISHVRNYSMEYYFGTTKTESIYSMSYEQFGRGGGIISYFQPGLLNLNNEKEILFGKGRYEVAISAEGRFTSTSSSDYGISHSGLIGEAGAMLYSFGYVGTLLMLLLGLIIISTLNNKKLVFILVLYYLWDFLFYYNQVIYSNLSAIFVLFIILYSNAINNRNRKQILLDNLNNITYDK